MEEITESLLPNQNVFDRPDVVVRVFDRKVKKFLKELKKGELFGKITAYCSSI